MTLKTEAIGKSTVTVVALLAVLAAGMGAAAEAQGAKLTAANYPATLEAHQLEPLTRLSFSGGIRYVECTEAELSGTLGGEKEEVTMTPTYTGCFTNGFGALPATITTNGCTFELKLTGGTTATLELVCPAGKEVEVHIYKNAADHVASQEWKDKGVGSDLSLCTYDIGPQLFKGEVTLVVDNAKTATEDLTATVSSTNIAVESTVGKAPNCGPKGVTTATLTSSTTITGFSKGAHTAIMTT